MDVQVVVVQGKQRGQTLRFATGEFVIGRGPECHLRPNSDWVSRQHCILRVGKDDVHIRDLGSTNGTLVNGVRVVGERRLDPGDNVQIGPLVLQILFEIPDTCNFRALDTDHDLNVNQVMGNETSPTQVLEDPQVPVKS
jgi:pSer/pThr/pTyr-binding forkhead associated (FHA) protein